MAAYEKLYFGLGILFIVGYKCCMGICVDWVILKTPLYFCWAGMCDKYSARFYIGYYLHWGLRSGYIATVTAQVSQL